MRMSALCTKHLFQNFRCGAHRLSVCVRLPVSRRFLSRSIQLSKVGLLCWSAGGISYSTGPRALCQQRGTPERKSVARLQVHSLVFILRLGLRALVLLLKFGPLLILYPLTLLSGRLASHWLDALLWVTETSGPTFMKLGQWASTRRDIFSQDFCDRFSRLHVRVKPHAWAHTKECLRRAFGEGWRQTFVFDSKEPVGSGCVAQVYRAKARVGNVDNPVFRQLLEDLEKNNVMEAWEIPGLGGALSGLWETYRDEEETVDFTERASVQREEERLIPVAIKVLHPGIRRQVQIDLTLMKAGSLLLDCLPGIKWLSLPEMVQEFEKLMTKQIDLRFEAQNMEKFQKNFRDLDYVKFPTPLRPFVTRSVLVETYEESEPISKYLSPEVPTAVKRRIARMGVELLLKMVFVDNFVHGDLHPGNILVQMGGGEAPQDRVTLTDLWDTVVVSVRWSGPPLQLVLLDAGIVAQLSEEDRRNFRDVFTAVVLKRGERVAELILHHARASECQDVTRFKKEMAELVDGALGDTLSLGKIQVAELLSQVFGLLIRHKVKLESNFASMVFAIMVLEGLGRSLDPHLDILEMAKVILLKNRTSLL
ncbi:putative aarF domain-containing protein kinase 2 [Triplophysa tibetana]|uniref:Putative aarF domain-containing protein kinase 2 n=1 Tax=Triplophysa tibetana TaxID=1572043 RepID=A0A5A9PWE9_9TELE|nr:putative aarF domain-containing protein kinase 2 [Triplophysa tibetana]